MAYIAIDIGGTQTKVGLVTAEGEILSRHLQKTPKGQYEALKETLIEVINWGLQEAARLGKTVKGLAFSLPCATDHLTAQSLSEGALIYIKHENPAKDMGELFNLPYSAENDGNCAALAEVWLGGAKEVSNMALVVCGTGIGGAVVIDRKIQHGKRNCAGEFGMIITGFDEAGQIVSWSLNGSTFALVKDYATRKGVAVEAVDGKMVFDLADGGDPLATQCVNRFYDHFVIGLHSLQHVYDPELILIGGGISSRKRLIEDLEAAMDRLYADYTEVLTRPEIQVCHFEADANLIGAVYHHQHFAIPVK